MRALNSFLSARARRHSTKPICLLSDLLSRTLDREKRKKYRRYSGESEAIHYISSFVSRGQRRRFSGCFGWEYRWQPVGISDSYASRPARFRQIGQLRPAFALGTAVRGRGTIVTRLFEAWDDSAGYTAAAGCR
ncbi:hypothetical protein EVAR_48204_1 [Eumeta japonica]|uniref:Uncharacterized protein n=1 Tax=Eumeta variegata TaxID=151549 RepID=A0A4C1XS66_EUMVA|nr:hypothetical protein EVAR_48204_1 [Eumeta japonica]